MSGTVSDPHFYTSNRTIGCIDPSRMNVSGTRNTLEIHFRKRIKELNIPMVKLFIFGGKEGFRFSSYFQILNAMSIQISGSLIILELIFQKFLYKPAVRVIQGISLLLMLVIFGPLFGLFRYFVSTMLNYTSWHKNDKFAVLILSMIFYAPNSIGSVEFLLPVGFRIIHIIYDTQAAWIIQTMLSAVLRYSLNLFLIFLYKPIRYVSGLITLMILVGIKSSAILLFTHRCLVYLEAVFIFIQGHEMSLPILFPFSMLCITALLIRSSQRMLNIVIVSLLILANISFQINFPYVQVSFINVGQGDSILVRTNTETLLIDTGKRNAYYALYKTLKENHIDTIDYLIITHPDNDHNGNVDVIKQDFNVTNFIDSKTIDLDTEDIVLHGLLDEYVGADDNANSRVFYLSISGISFLLTADITQIEEMRLMTLYPNLKIDVLKLAHHGSKTASSLSFLKSIQPRYAIVSAQHSVYGHPHSIVLANLAKVQATVLNTETSGTITFIFSNITHFIITNEREFAIINQR